MTIDMNTEREEEKEREGGRESKNIQREEEAEFNRHRTKD